MNAKDGTFLGFDARGWIGIGSFILVVMVLWMVAKIPELRHDEFFKVIATALITTAWINGPVGWAYQATKGGGELAEKNATLVETAVTSNGEPQKVTIDQPLSDPVPVAPQGDAEPEQEELPDYAR